MTLLAKRASSRSERIVRSMCGGFLGVARRWNGGDPGVMATTIGPMTTPYCSKLRGGLHAGIEKRRVKTLIENHSRNM